VELLRESQAIVPDAMRIVLTAYSDVDNLMEAINTGKIFHFVAKPWDPPRRGTPCSGAGKRAAARGVGAGPEHRAPRGSGGAGTADRVRPH